MTKRIYVRVPDDVWDTVAVWSEKLSVTMSQLGGMALQAGLASILRTIDPIGSVSPEQMAKILEGAKIAGIEIEDLQKGANKDEQE